MTPDASDLEPAVLDSTVLDNLSRMVGAQKTEEIVDVFLNYSPTRLSAVQKSAGAGDLKSCAEALHSLRSSAEMLGANRLCELATRMERLAAAGDHDAVAELVESLLGAYDEAEVLLRARGERPEARP